MSSLRLVAVGVDLPAGSLFDGVHLHLAAGQRLALVGENGAGKTTLLRVMAGELIPDRGRVHRDGEVVRLSQALTDEGPPGSGGERQRRRLEAVRAAQPDLILLDEPTHHLDADGLAWLTEWLLTTTAGVVVVAHDRAFLDAVATDVAFLARGALRPEAGGYTVASGRAAAADAGQARRYRSRAAQQERIAAAAQRERARARSAGSFNPRRADGLSKLGAKNRAESVSRTLARRASAMTSRLERMATIEKPFDDRRRLDFLAAPSTLGPNDVLTARGLVVRRGGRTLVDDLDLFVRRGERIALVGPNGSGKTTLLDVLRGALEPDAGEVRRGVGLRSALVTQTVEPEMADVCVGDLLRRLRGDLRDADVWRTTAAVGVPCAPERRLGELSGGERRRLTLAGVMVADAHLLVLDEPTHHLDIGAVEALERLLLAFPGTVLLASHDRQLVERVATHVWRFTAESGLDGRSVSVT
jgi:ATPase subunit of ABC transporter with duplicated ATPase domains